MTGLPVVQIYNIKRFSFKLRSTCYNAVLLQVAGEEWGENEKDWVKKVGEKKMAAVFCYDRARGSR